MIILAQQIIVFVNYCGVRSYKEMPLATKMALCISSILQAGSCNNMTFPLLPFVANMFRYLKWRYWTLFSAILGGGFILTEALHTIIQLI